MLKNLIERALILESLEATIKSDALEEMLTCAVRDGHLAEDRQAAVAEKLRAREQLGSTGIGNGVAVPHVKSPELERVALVFARSAAGLDYQAVDGREVHTVFMILAPESEAEAHLAILQWVSRLARDADFRRFAQNAGGADELRDLLLEMCET